MMRKRKIELTEIRMTDVNKALLEFAEREGDACLVQPQWKAVVRQWLMRIMLC